MRRSMNVIGEALPRLHRPTAQDNRAIAQSPCSRAYASVQAAADWLGFEASLTGMHLKSVWYPRLIDGVPKETHGFRIDRPGVWQQRCGKSRQFLILRLVQLMVTVLQESGREI